MLRQLMSFGLCILWIVVFCICLLAYLFMYCVYRCSSIDGSSLGWLLDYVSCVPAFCWLLSSHVWCMSTSPLACSSYHTCTVVRCFQSNVRTYCLWIWTVTFLLVWREVTFLVFAFLFVGFAITLRCNTPTRPFRSSFRADTSKISILKGERFVFTLAKSPW